MRKKGRASTDTRTGPFTCLRRAVGRSEASPVPMPTAAKSTQGTYRTCATYYNGIGTGDTGRCDMFPAIMGRPARPRLLSVRNGNNAMAFIPALNTARVAMHFSRDAQLVENVFYVENASGWDATSLEALANDVTAWWTTNLQPVVASNLSLNEVVCTDLTTSSGVSVVYAAGLPAAGGSGSTALPNNVTIAIKLITGFGGRSFRGRQYINGMVQANLATDQNTVGPAFVSGFQGFYNTLIATLLADFPPGLVIASFYHGVDSLGKPIPRSTAVLTPVTNAVFADNVLDSQRRRLPGRGR